MFHNFFSLVSFVFFFGCVVPEEVQVNRGVDIVTDTDPVTDTYTETDTDTVTDVDTGVETGVDTGADTGTDCDDGDGDGHCVDVDCDDDDPAIHPNAIEHCYDGLDTNCNGTDRCRDLLVEVTMEGGFCTPFWHQVFIGGEAVLPLTFGPGSAGLVSLEPGGTILLQVLCDSNVDGNAANDGDFFGVFLEDGLVKDFVDGFSVHGVIFALKPSSTDPPQEGECTAHISPPWAAFQCRVPR